MGKCWKWLTAHFCAGFRLALAVLILLGGFIPLVNCAKGLVDHSYTDFPTTTTETVRKPVAGVGAPADKVGTQKAKGDARRRLVQEEQTVRTESAAVRVWVFALRLVAVFAGLGFTLWAIVALCRVD